MRHMQSMQQTYDGLIVKRLEGDSMGFIPCRYYHGSKYACPAGDRCQFLHNELPAGVDPASCIVKIYAAQVEARIDVDQMADIAHSFGHVLDVRALNSIYEHGRRAFFILMNDIQAASAFVRHLNETSLGGHTPIAKVDMCILNRHVSHVMPEEAPAMPAEAPAMPAEAPAMPAEAPAMPAEAPAMPAEAPEAESVLNDLAKMSMFAGKLEQTIRDLYNENRTMRNRMVHIEKLCKENTDLKKVIVEYKKNMQSVANMLKTVEESTKDNPKKSEHNKSNKETEKKLWKDVV